MPHPRISLHQVPFMAAGVGTFIDHCEAIGVRNMTLVSLALQTPDALHAARTAVDRRGMKVTTVNHPFATFPNLERDTGMAAEKLIEAIDIADTLGAKAIYVLAGGRGSLDWEQAAGRFAELIAPCKAAAAQKGITLLVENASPFNIDIHIAHTLADAITLAEIAGIGVCIDLQPCWGEARLKQSFRRAMPIAGLVQVSDYVLGDRVAPCRAVPGDGAVPLERLIGDLLDAGYQGLFDLELVGPRIDAEGAAPATTRAAERLSEMLERLGA